MNGAPRGYLMLLAIVFGAVFLSVIGGLAGFALSEHRFQTMAHLRTQAFAFAEAGLEQYRFRFLQGLESLESAADVFTEPYRSSEGEVLGEVTVSTAPIAACGEVVGRTVRSQGSTSSESASAVVAARYARPSVAEYAFITNSNVHVGAGRVVNGPLHANGGVYVEGEVYAPVTSSLLSWNCTEEYGCMPAQTVDGVFGTEESSSFWKYPTPQIDFGAIAASFPVLKDIAGREGTYLPRISFGQKNTDSYWRGYRLVFVEDGTVMVYRVTATEPITPSIWANASDAYDGTQDRSRITSSVMQGTYTLPDDCGLIYVEDHVWVEGVVSGKITLVAANADPAISPNVYVHDTISYSSGSVLDGLTVIAEHNVLIALDAPEDLSISGILIAQNGSIGRNAYACSVEGAVRGVLTLVGSIVSNKRVATAWPAIDCEEGVGGYQTRIDVHDRVLSHTPPPFTPHASDEFRFLEWREE